MSMLVQHDVRTNWKDTYNIALKLFDLEQNPKPLFDKSNGAIEDVDITVSLTHQKIFNYYYYTKWQKLQIKDTGRENSTLQKI